MRSDGSYVQRRPPAGKPGKSCQQAMIEWAERRLKEVTRLRKRRTRGIQRRNVR